MKKILMFVILILSTSLFADLDNFKIVNQTDTDAKVSTNCFAVQNDTDYFTYRQKNADSESIVFSKSNNNGQSFISQEIFTADELSEPNISIFNGEIYIFFADKNTGKFYIANSNDNGISFNVTENLNPQIFNTGTEIVANNQLNILSRTGRTRRVSAYASFYKNFVCKNNVNAYFTGITTIRGNFHTNTELKIIDAAGTANPDAPNWPLFLGYTTVGQTITYPDNTLPPMDLIFQGGYSENVAKLEFNNNDAVQNCLTPFGNMSNDNVLIYMNMTGESCTAYVGAIQTVGIDTLVIYDSYPPYGPVGDSIGVNYITRKDTVWTEINIDFPDNQSILVPDVLYLKGQVSGRHTIYCKKSVYITGDITYNATCPGMSPDDEEDPNTTDYFGLISDGNIFISYGYYSPELGLYQKVNCNGIMLYGSYAAIKDNDNPLENSVFTFEYQHPHPSTEPCVYNNQYYDKIDLHLHKFPPDEDNPWPANLDYPYYNPLWPESAEHLTFERGTINLFGSMAQVNAGYIHRSGSDLFNHSTPPVWDLENHLYGAIHQPTGYFSNYHYDKRLLYNAPPNFCQVENIDDDVNPQIKLLSSTNGNDFTVDLSLNDVPVKSSNFDINDNLAALVISNDCGTSLGFYNNNENNYSEFQISNDTWEIINVKITDKIYILAKPYYGKGYSLYSYDTTTNDLTTIYSDAENNYPQNIACDTNGNLIIAKTTNENVEFYKLCENQLENIYSKPISDLSYPINSCDNMTFAFDSDNQVYLIYNNTENYHFGNIYFSMGSLPSVENHNDEINPVKQTITNYPNPFVLSGNKRSANTTFQFTLKQNSNVKINVYNLKGQKVADVLNKNLSKGEHKINWNAQSISNKKLASGIYFYKFEINDKIVAVKKCMIIK